MSVETKERDDVDVNDALDLYPESVRQEMAKMVREKAKAAPAEYPSEQAAVRAFDDLEPLPLPGDPYKAHSRPDDRPHHKLALLFRGVGFLLLDYGDFDSAEYRAGEAGKSPSMILRFKGLRPTEYELTGHDLRPLGSHLVEHRIFWIREHPTGTVPKDSDEMVIAKINPRLLQT